MVLVGIVWATLIGLFLWQICLSAVDSAVERELREIDRKLREQSRDVSRIDSV